MTSKIFAIVSVSTVLAIAFPAASGEKSLIVPGRANGTLMVWTTGDPATSVIRLEKLP
jgi:hypothetical protein